MALTDAYQAGLRYLTRREHGETELARKLRAKGFEEFEVESALKTLLSEGYLSDVRFAENYTRSRLNSGWGPVTIVQELLSKGVPDEISEAAIAALDNQWAEVAQVVRLKKFGQTLPDNFQDKAKQMRFLQYRGFTQTQIHYAFEMINT